MPGKVGQALSFDNTNDKVVVNAAPVSVAPLTLCAWARRNTKDTFLTIVSINDGSNDQFSIGFDLQLTTNSVVAQALQGLTGGWAAAPNGSVSLRRWHHICGVFSSAAARTVYLDGALAGTDTSGFSPVPAGLIRVEIGSEPVDTNALGADVDDVRIYNRVLSAEEIKRLYEMGK